MNRRRTSKLDYQWNLRQLMAHNGMFATSDLAPHLAERGIDLSATQVYRLVVNRPERLNLRILVALCDVLDCTPSELIEPIAEKSSRSKRAAGQETAPAPAAPPQPKRARVGTSRKR